MTLIYDKHYISVQNPPDLLLFLFFSASILKVLNTLLPIFTPVEAKCTGCKIEGNVFIKPAETALSNKSSIRNDLYDDLNGEYTREYVVEIREDGVPLFIDAQRIFKRQQEAFGSPFTFIRCVVICRNM